MESRLPAFREKNPQLDVVTQLIRGQHPHLKGLYRKYLSLSLSLPLLCEVKIRISFTKCTGNKNEKVICVKNMDPEDVLLHAIRLRNSLGERL